MITPVVVLASSGYFAEVAAIAARPAPTTASVRIVGVVALGAPVLIADLANRLGVATAESLEGLAEQSAIRLGSPIDDVPVGLVVAGGSIDARTAALQSPHRRPTLVHADATVGPWVELGAGTIVSPGARITAHVVVGEGSLIHTGAVLSHDDQLGDLVTVSPSATLCGGVVVGDRSTIFAGATVMPGVRIGCDVTVGAGALVRRDVPDGATVAGVPARVM